MGDRIYKATLIILFGMVCLVGGGLIVQTTFEHPTKEQKNKIPSIIKRTEPYGINNYKVTIIGTTNEVILQDCADKKKDTSGFHVGQLEVDGKPRYILYCGHRPDRVGKIVKYKIKEGI